MVLAAVVVFAVCAFAGCNLIKGLLGLNQQFSLEAEKLKIEIGELYDVGLSADSIKESFVLTSSDTNKVQIVDNTKIKGVAKTDSDVTVTAKSSSGKTATVKVEVTYASLSELNIAVTAGTLIQLTGDEETDAQQISFAAVANPNISPETKFTWRAVKKSTGAVVKTKTGANAADNTFTYTPADKGAVYTVTLSADGGLSDSVECGYFSTVYISLEKAYYGLTAEVSADVIFRLPAGYLSSTAAFTVFLNNVNTGSQTVSYRAEGDYYTATVNLGVLAEGDYTLRLVFNGENSNAVSFEVVDITAVDHAYVSVTSGSLTQKGVSGSAVTFNATLDPVTADTDRVEWYVNGALQSTSGQTFVYTPASHGEYHITAVADKAESHALTLVYLSSTENTITDYLNTEHYYGGYAQNTYITTQEELNNIVCYALENHLHGSGATALNLYIDYSPGISISDKIDEARLSVNESGVIASCEMSTYPDGKRTSIVFNYTLENNDTITYYPSAEPANTKPNPTQSSVSQPCYAIGTYSRSFYIDGANVPTMNVSTSNMLYKAVMWGYRPVISATNTGLTTIYANARSVLAKIITDDMTDLQKVHAIYDWVVYNVRYDFDLSESANTNLNDSMKYYGYYLEGIFKNMSDSHAVCDGKSKAFTLMCGIEGINSLRVTGDAVTSESSGGHAWNKVLVDTDDDGFKEWYVVDTTWGDVNISSSYGSVYTEYLTHSHFLVSDSDVSGTHIEDGDKDYPAATGSYDYYADNKFTYYSATYDYSAAVKSEIGAILNYAQDHNMDFVEIKVTYNCGEFPGFNNIADYYISGSFSAFESSMEGVYCVILP